MGIAAVLVYRDHGCIRAHQLLAAKSLQNPLLDFKLVGAAVADTTADFLKGRGGDFVQCLAGREVSFDLLLSESGLEKSDQITRADNVLTQPANQLQGAAINQ